MVLMRSILLVVAAGLLVACSSPTDTPSETPPTERLQPSKGTLSDELNRNWENAPDQYKMETCIAWGSLGPEQFREMSKPYPPESEWAALRELLGRECNELYGTPN